MVGKSGSGPAHVCRAVPGQSWPAAKDSVWLLLWEPQAGVCPAQHCPPRLRPCLPSRLHQHEACAGHAPHAACSAPPPAPGDVLYELLQYIKTQRQALVCGPLLGRAFRQKMPRGHCPCPQKGGALSSLLGSLPERGCLHLFPFLLISPWTPFLSVSRALHSGVTTSTHGGLLQPPTQWVTLLPELLPRLLGHPPGHSPRSPGF